MKRPSFFRQALILLCSLFFFSLWGLWFMPTPLGERLRSLVGHLLKYLIP